MNSPLTHTRRPPTVAASHPGDARFPASPVCVITSKGKRYRREEDQRHLRHITAVITPRLDVDSAY